MSAPPPPRRYLDQLARAVAHIEAHLDAPLTAERLAECAAMSRHHFHRIFRAYFGTTVAGYLAWRRLQRACELLAAEPASVLDVALAVGYESAQALAKAMRRELDTTPSAVRAGAAPAWQRLFDRRAAEQPDAAAGAMLRPRLIELPALQTLTASGRGMVEGGNLGPVVRQGLGELIGALQGAGLMSRLCGCISMLPREPEGPDAEIWVGALFDAGLAGGASRPPRPDLPLAGSLAWRELPAGRHAVFTHLGPYDELCHTWGAIYRDWLPATGYLLRDAPPFEHYVNDPRVTPPAELRTDIHLPLQ